jgi:hypothetical protein
MALQAYVLIQAEPLLAGRVGGAWSTGLGADRSAIARRPYVGALASP